MSLPELLPVAPLLADLLAMSKRYLLPCPSCQHAQIVEPAQAGREINCPSCQSAVLIPTLRKMQSLEPAEAAPAKSKSARDWLPENRISFSVSLGIFFLGLIVAGSFQGIRSSLDTNIPANPQRDQMFNEIDNASADSLFELWKEMIRKQELSEQPPNPIVANIKRSRGLFVLVVVGTVIACGGLIATAWFGYQGWSNSRKPPAPNLG